MSQEGQSNFTLEELSSIYRGDAEGMDEVLELFAADAQPRVRRLQADLKEGNREAAIEAAHGLSNLLGAVRNHDGVRLARETEAALKKGNERRAQELAPKIGREVDGVLREIERRSRER